MAVDVQIPTLGESVSEGVIVRWNKQNGERVAADELLFELETDKASVEIPAPSAGRPSPRRGRRPPPGPAPPAIPLDRRHRQGAPAPGPVPPIKGYRRRSV